MLSWCIFQWKKIYSLYICTYATKVKLDQTLLLTIYRSSSVVMLQTHKEWKSGFVKPTSGDVSPSVNTFSILYFSLYFFFKIDCNIKNVTFLCATQKKSDANNDFYYCLWLESTGFQKSDQFVLNKYDGIYTIQSKEAKRFIF